MKIYEAEIWRGTQEEIEEYYKSYLKEHGAREMSNNTISEQLADNLKNGYRLSKVFYMKHHPPKKLEHTKEVTREAFEIVSQIVEII